MLGPDPLPVAGRVVAEAPAGVVNIGGEWYFEEYGPGNSISTLGTADLNSLSTSQFANLSTAQVQAMNEETRQQGLGRAVNVLLPGISGFCAPVFDADGHLALGVVAMGSTATLETDWQGPVAQAMRAFAAQLSADLGWPQS